MYGLICQRPNELARHAGEIEASVEAPGCFAEVSVRVLSELEGVVATVNSALDVVMYGVDSVRSRRDACGAASLSHYQSPRMSALFECIERAESMGIDLARRVQMAGRPLGLVVIAVYFESSDLPSNRAQVVFPLSRLLNFGLN